MLGFFVVLVRRGVWLLGTMADVRKAQDCAAQGRRNCAPSKSRMSGLTGVPRLRRSEMRI